MLRQLVHIHGPLHAETDLAKHGIRWYLAEALFLTLTTAQAFMSGLKSEQLVRGNRLKRGCLNTAMVADS